MTRGEIQVRLYLWLPRLLDPSFARECGATLARVNTPSEDANVGCERDDTFPVQASPA